VEEELDGVVGHDSEVKISDLANMPYLSVVVKEMLRLHLVIPLLIPHQATEFCKGTQVMVNVWAIGRNPSLWENPLRFYPEHLLESHLSNITIHGQSFGFLPFGSGRRICPARKLGFLSVKLIVANLVHQIDLRHSMVPKLTTSSRGLVLELETPLIVRACLKKPVGTL
jgi:cytochrome P450